jgi:NAD+ synthase (glutamine-hydrolysing)
MDKSKSLKIALAQFDFPVGGIQGNLDRARDLAEAARRAGADLVLFPEMTLSGYPPEDLLLRPGFLESCHRALERFAAGVEGIDAVIGHPWAEQGRRYNAVSWIRDGRVIGRYFKKLLPNYLVFDECRYFSPGGDPLVVEVRGVPVGVIICEDAWQPGPAQAARDAGAELLLIPNASPYRDDKLADREKLFAGRHAETGLPMVYCNLVGGQDELVFDGRSMLMNRAGELSEPGPLCEERLLIAEYDQVAGSVEWSDCGRAFRPDETPVAAEAAPTENLPPTTPAGGPSGPTGESQFVGGPSGPTATGQASVAAEAAPTETADQSAEFYTVIKTGLRDYVRKNGFSDVVFGLSGGIDSSLVLALAVDALGADRVHTVMMPSRHTSGLSIELAQQQAVSLGADHRVISIEPAFEALLTLLEPSFFGREADVTEENLQARARSNLVMALSNKFGWLPLVTSNKSELAVGYSTIYGDMAGGFAPLLDCSKTRVYELARWRNTVSPAIPESVITRPPSAELRPDQKDQDSLPPYDMLDAILQRYVEQDWSVEQIVADGFDEATVRRVANLVLINEYKRRQAPPGVRITHRAFGRDRRYPITSQWRNAPVDLA